MFVTSAGAAESPGLHLAGHEQHGGGGGVNLEFRDRPAAGHPGWPPSTSGQRGGNRSRSHLAGHRRDVRDAADLGCSDWTGTSYPQRQSRRTAPGWLPAAPKTARGVDVGHRHLAGCGSDVGISDVAWLSDQDLLSQAQLACNLSGLPTAFVEQEPASTNRTRMAASVPGNILACKQFSGELDSGIV